MDVYTGTQRLRTTFEGGKHRRIALAAFTGTAMEWYDFYLFGTAAALVFGDVFFPSEDPVAGALAAFATFAIGFVARPLGAIIFGHIGDRVGRKRSLMITIWMMGISTSLVGFIPGSHSIGIIGAILLVGLRLIQGIAMGGEWSGASAMITEQTPSGKRGFYAMLPQLGNPAGIFVGTITFSILTAVLTTEAFSDWGWRVPFIMALPFMLIVVWLRRALPDGPTVEVSESEHHSAPLGMVASTYKKALSIGIGVALLGVAGYYFVNTFVLNYATRELGLDPTPLLNASLVGSATNVLLFLVWGLLANRIGGVNVGLLGATASAIFALPIFAIVVGGSQYGVAFAMIAGSALISISYAACGEVLNGLFPAHVRQTATGIAYSMAGVIAGLVPFFATFVLDITDNSIWWTGSILVALSVITVVSLLSAKRRPILLDD
ncbi:MFS transporter [Rhodococcus sp. NPDC049939]|uniref:MFS transporter n=1 Tax=Rhodococcus sp. NPDC049939 TaxID=3155511 RepID=UPI0033D25C11